MSNADPKRLSFAELLAEAELALRGLKDFQRTTVEHVFERLFSPGSSKRFLVADEVGLGKTLVAKGIIAKSIQHLRGKVNRIDVVYVCSNGDIARQNMNRLQIGGAFAPTSRLTMLARLFESERWKEQTDVGVNFVAFTPGTSFDIDDGLGLVDERVLLYQLLEGHWGIDGRAAAINVFAGYVEPHRFRARLEAAERVPTSKTVDRLRSALGCKPELAQEFAEICEAYPTARSRPALAMRSRRAKLIGALRTELAKVCIELLEPDLIILDEFQRFTHLLDADSEAGDLARMLFEWKDAHVLLLSATPYKMYTTANEADGQEHYAEFLRTVRFLERSRASEADCQELLEEYRSALEHAAEPNGSEQLLRARHALELRLRSVMVRTERLASTPDRNGMLRAMDPVGKLEKRDVLDYLALQKTATLLEQRDNVVEYWKSGAFVLNFMDEGYKLKQQLLAQAEDPESRLAIARALSSSGSSCLPFESHATYGPLDPPNARVRELFRDTVDRGVQRLLWIAPSCPYYRLRGVFADAAIAGFSKRLIFSSWRFVPRQIAALLSYEAERRMIVAREPRTNSADRRRQQARPLRFERTENESAARMTTLALLYPSSFLARACDPLRFASELAGSDGVPALDNVLDAAVQQIDLALRRLPPGAETGPIDERWYWAAPLLLDRTLEPAATQLWFEQPNLAALWAGTADDEDNDEDAAERNDEVWRLHVERAREVTRNQAPELGRRPDDLAQTLAELALGGPGVIALRSMLRVVRLRPDALGKEGSQNVRNAAAQVAFHFRTLFNQPEVIELLRSVYPNVEDGYWRIVLRYCIDGCLQSVLDEYTHVLRDDLGLSGVRVVGERVHEIGEWISKALSLRTSNIAVQDVGLSAAGRTLRPTVRRMRCHFALRFGDERDEEGEIQTRADAVRRAFNSPFWPFVVATTSVGQEGLDFHTYCHAVVHWNLPSNPVDLEQREGRVHRFKGHAVRKNVGKKHLAEAIASGEPDVWEAMFALAERDRNEQMPEASDIVPYWVYTVEGGAQIERHVWAHPSSKDTARLHALIRSLTVYRMAFGQPRQDDLLRYLQTRVPEAALESIAKIAVIDLSPSGEIGAAT